MNSKIPVGQIKAHKGLYVRAAGIMLTRCQWDTVKDSRSSVAEAACGELAGLCVDLGEKRQLQVREAGKKLAVDIREFYDKDGDLAPGRKGACALMSG
jgi:hypothetical protein